MRTKTNSIKYLRHSIGLYNWSNKKWTYDQVSELANSQCMILFSGLLNNYISINLFKHLKHSACFY